MAKKGTHAHGRNMTHFHSSDSAVTLNVISKKPYEPPSQLIPTVTEGDRDTSNSARDTSNSARERETPEKGVVKVANMDINAYAQDQGGKAVAFEMPAIRVTDILSPMVQAHSPQAHSPQSPWVERLSTNKELWNRLVNRLRGKQPPPECNYSANIDIWWVADDGGLTVLLPHILVTYRSLFFSLPSPTSSSALFLLALLLLCS